MIHYLGSFEKTIDIFGYLFSDIHIRRWINDNGTKFKKDIQVPIEFSGKERMFYLLMNKMKDENIKLDTVFPRMGYTISDIQYDSSRMLNRNQLISHTIDESGIEVFDGLIKITSASVEKYGVDWLEKHNINVK